MSGRWTADRARDWMPRWRSGCFFIPSTAENTTAQWQRSSWDEPTQTRELAWAAGLGFDVLRVFLPYTVWAADPQGLLQRMEWFLSQASINALQVMPTLFDDCAFSGRLPTHGEQPKPLPGVHNSAWTASPGAHLASDRSAWLRLEEYVAAVVGRFARDERILLWDLYNEPGNNPAQELCLPLLEAVSAWARAAQPLQPLTIGLWNDEPRFAEQNEFCLQVSDIISIHCYDHWAATARRLEALPTDRPVVLSEWMARHLGSTILTHLPGLKRRGVHSIATGLVRGATQAHLPWPHLRCSNDPDLWFHDFLEPDGTAWHADEVQALRRINGRVPANAHPCREASQAGA